jgi:hypothetical protein
MTARFGCPGCGQVITAGEDFTACARGDVATCPVPAVELPIAADVLAFRLRMKGRGDEATRVLDDVATLQEHRPSTRL